MIPQILMIGSLIFQFYCIFQKPSGPREVSYLTLAKVIVPMFLILQLILYCGGFYKEMGVWQYVALIGFTLEIPWAMYNIKNNINRSKFIKLLDFVITTFLLILGGFFDCFKGIFDQGWL